MQLQNHFEQNPEYYNLCLSFLPACWFLIYSPTTSISDTNWIISASFWLIRQLQPQPMELFRVAENVPQAAQQYHCQPVSAWSALWDWGNRAALQRAKATLPSDSWHSHWPHGTNIEFTVLILKSSFKLLKPYVDGTLK